VSSTFEDIRAVTDEVCEMLQSKNKSYGDTALNPRRVFSKAATMEQLKVRIDDKLSRIATGSTEFAEDTELDLIGYLILLRIAHKRNAANTPPARSISKKEVVVTDFEMDPPPQIYNAHRDPAPGR